MSMPRELFKSTHVVVLGNEKGGSGKSTTAMHIITALLSRHKTVGSIDLDGRQRSLTRYLENREDWARRKNLQILMPRHFTVSMDDGGDMLDPAAREEREFVLFAEAVSELEHNCDFIVIDTPGTDNALNRLGHSMADTLITPINDSFVDLDVIAHVVDGDYSNLRPSQYARMVAGARKRREAVDGGSIDWIVVRNRMTVPVSHNSTRIAEALNKMRGQLGFRLAAGVGERVIFRELFPKGLTLFDVPGNDSDITVTMSHVAGRQELHALLANLNLPIEDNTASDTDTGRARKNGQDRQVETPAKEKDPAWVEPSAQVFTIN